MKQSKLFGKTRRDISKDEKSINAELLIKAGFIEKHMAGVYNYLPLGLKVFRKVENIIREEMDAVDGQEMLMTALQPKELWDKTGRWSEMEDIMYQFEDGHGSEVGLATTHEEVVTELAKQQIKSYRDLPIYIYQIQDKFRNEKRAKSGLLRGREFSMKDLYSFHTDEKDLDKSQKYSTIIRSLKEISESCQDIVNRAYEHVDNFHNEFLDVQKDEIRQIKTSITRLLENISIMMLKRKKVDYDYISNQCNKLERQITEFDRNQIRRIQNSESTTRLSILFYGFLENSLKISRETRSLLEILRESFSRE